MRRSPAHRPFWSRSWRTRSPALQSDRVRAIRTRAPRRCAPSDGSAPAIHRPLSPSRACARRSISTREHFASGSCGKPRSRMPRRQRARDGVTRSSGAIVASRFRQDHAGAARVEAARLRRAIRARRRRRRPDPQSACRRGSAGGRGVKVVREVVSDAASRAGACTSGSPLREHAARSDRRISRP